jgi:2-dehydro-3-deoxy-D-gluconate 5-dehydrogenase
MGATIVEYGREVARDLFDLTGRRALVTGGGRGLGRGMAEALAAAGATVALVGRSEQVEVAARELGGVAVRADLADAGERDNAYERAVGELGGLDVLVTAHGTTRRAPALELTSAEWDDVVATNLSSVFELCRLAARRMVAQGSGKIVTVASMLSFSGGLNVSAYAASKGGVAQLTKALANEWAPHGVNVNAVAPGYFRTELTAPLWRDDPERNAEILARLPAGRWGEPADLAGAVVFLASAASDYVHGIVLPVDGGWLAR